MDTAAQEQNHVSVEALKAYQDGVGKALDAHDVALLKQMLETTKPINHPAYKDPWTSLASRGYITEKAMIPLVQAVKYGDSVMAELLLQAGAADVNMADDDPLNPKYRFTDKLTPLMFAAAAGDLPVCRMLHSYGADVNATVRAGGSRWTALHAAAHQGHLHIADWLFKHGARLPQNDESSATWIAAWKDNPRLVELFVNQHEHFYPGSQLQNTIHRTLYARAESSALVLLFHGHHFTAKICNQACKPMSKASCERCFSEACFAGFTNILHTMISYNPQLMQAKCLGTPREQCSRQHKEFVATLVEQGKQPVSLQWLCKSAILCCLDGKSAEIINNKIKRFLLPNILKSFLQLYDPCKGKCS